MEMKLTVIGKDKSITGMFDVNIERKLGQPYQELDFTEQARAVWPVTSIVFGLEHDGEWQEGKCVVSRKEGFDENLREDERFVIDFDNTCSRIGDLEHHWCIGYRHTESRELAISFSDDCGLKFDGIWIYRKA